MPDWTGPEDEHVMRPVAVLDCPFEADLARGDHFGPVIAVIRCRDLEEVLHRHRQVDQVLATSVFTRHPARVGELLDALRSGIVSINDCTIPAGHPGSPITGRGPSGWGSSQGQEGLLELTRPVMLSRTGQIGRLPTDVPGPFVQNFLRRMLRRGV